MSEKYGRRKTFVRLSGFANPAFYGHFALLLPLLALFAAGCKKNLSPPPPLIVLHDFVNEFDSALLSDIQWLDIGSPESLKYLSHGWGRPEKDPTGATYAYAVGGESSIKFWVNDVSESDVLRAAFRAQAFPYPGAPPQDVDVFVNGMRVGGFVLTGEFSTPVVDIPSTALKTGENTLTLKFGWTKKPSEAIEGSADNRPLAAYFDYAIIFGDERLARLFMSAGVMAGKAPIAGWSIKALKMPIGAGLRYPDILVAKGARLKFAVAQESDLNSSAAMMEVLFKPQGGKVVSMFSGRVAPANVRPENFDIDMSSVGPARGDVIFRVKPEGDDIGKTGLLWIRPRLELRRPNVLLVVADALRADKLGCYGGPVKTPNIDALAGDGALFKNAFSHYPGTPPSFATIFTGKLPPNHGLRLMSGKLSTGEYTLAQNLDGLFTHRGGFPALIILPESSGFNRGFTRYNLDGFKSWLRDGGEVNAEALPWLKRHGKEGFFAFIHYADTHEPYAASGSFHAELEVTLDDKSVSIKPLDRPGNVKIRLNIPPGAHKLGFHINVSDKCLGRDGEPPTVALKTDWTALKIDLISRGFEDSAGYIRVKPDGPVKLDIANPTGKPFDETLDLFVDVVGGGDDGCPGGDIQTAYEREVAYMDRQFGELEALLKEIGAWDSAIVIFTSDHGEALNEHGHMGHIDQLYDESLHVPLIIRAPWLIPRGRVIETQAGLMDVAPTLLALLGLPPIDGADGESLLPLIAGKTTERPIFFETFVTGSNEHLAGIRAPRWKLIRAMDGEKVELYDLSKDPGERNNVAVSQPERVEIMTDTLNRFLENRAPVHASGDLPSDMEKRLRAMGYIK